MDILANLQGPLILKAGSVSRMCILSLCICVFLQALPLSKLRGFGGKLGAQLQQLGAVTAGDVQAMPLQQLQRHFGDKTRRVYNLLQRRVITSMQL